MLISAFKGLVGGFSIGLSAIVLMALIGRIAGISGIAAGALFERGGDRRWRLAFVAGVIAASPLLALLGLEWGNVAAGPGRLIGDPVHGVGIMLVAGLLVGLGTSIGSGCTSGHGVCGLARLSPRSMVATAVFVGVAMLTVFLVRNVAGAGA
ncbi:YeeE/YedE family protein [Salinicola avicenniae]|uniref:YeeE/YedE family protein n=1 Tax=Salinicola avicenniae TaxID=2916836 RepID=UPI002073A2F9|nr:MULTISPECIES: YeeE/YedE family protein [unclassified Salinicola]